MSEHVTRLRPEASSTKTVRMSALLAGICLATMSILLLLTALVFTAYDVRGHVAFRIYNPFSVTVVGFYIFVFLAANTALSLPSLRPGTLLAVPTAMLAGCAIVAGPLYGWLIKAGALAAIAVSFVIAAGTFFAVLLLPLVGPLVGPVATGCLTGLLVHCIARTIADQPLWV